ncbi:MAG: ABC transporter permease [Caldilineaceae bacterium]|nr:ABC transporter permease [Caldilineaceae bacterium]
MKRDKSQSATAGVTHSSTGEVLDNGEEHRSLVERIRFWITYDPAVTSIIAFFLIVFVYFSVTTESFLTQANVLNVIRQSAPTLIAAVAMTFVITTGGIDLSVGSTLAMVSALSAIALQAGWPWWITVLVMLVTGAVIGVVNGWFVAYERIPAFIVTLATLSIVRGVALLITQGYSIPVAPDSPFVAIGRGTVLGIPIPALLAIVVALIGHIVLTQTRYGQYVTGSGANMEAVRRAGVSTRRVLLRTYAISGVAAALGGVIIAARLGSGSSNAGVGFELEVIAAVVLGGTNMFGGHGTILGTIFGTLTIGIINNGLILSHLSPFLTQIVTGIIILLAIWINTRVFSTVGQLRRR